MSTLSYQEQRQNWRIDAWLESRGISRAVIERHPYCQDIRALLDFREEFEQELQQDRFAMASWGALWNVSYRMQKPIKTKYWKKLEQVALRCITTRQEQAQRRARIKALRGTSQTQNKDHDMTAKGSNLPEVMHTKWDNEGGRGTLEQLPPGE